jgi:hypothetical protein
VKRGVVVAVLLALCAADSRAGTEAPATCGKVLPPSWGAYLGAFADFNAGDVASEDQVRAPRIESFERLAGRRLSWVYFSQNWYRWLQFPRERVQTIWRHGSVPYIAFLPTSGDFYGSGRQSPKPEPGTRCSGSSTASSTASSAPGLTARAGQTCRSCSRSARR